MIRSIKIGMLGLCLVSMLAMSAVGASSAFAGKHNPTYGWCQKVATPKTGAFKDSQCKEKDAKKESEFEEFGVSLSEKQALEGTANGNQELKSAKFVLICKALKLENANVFGGEFEFENLKKEKFKVGGKDESVVVYEKCEVSGSPKCLINGEKTGIAKIKTNATESATVFETKKAAEEEKVESPGKVAQGLVVFKPKAGETFVTFELKGEVEASNCPVTGKVNVEGEVLAKMLGNPEEQTENHEIELTSKKEYFQNNGTEQVEKKVKGLTVLLLAAEVKGKVKLNLASKDCWKVLN